jgi:hypothetical protein
MATKIAQADTSQYSQIYSLAVPAGIKRDGTVFQSEQYTDGVWCRFQRGDAKKIGGYREIFTSTTGIYRGLVSLPVGGVNYIFAGNAYNLDVFTTGSTYGIGSGPFVVNMLPGTTKAAVASNTSTQVVVNDDVSTVFQTGDKIVLEQTMTAVEYTVSTSVFSTASTTITFTPSITGSPTVNTVWLADDPIFTPDPITGPDRITWQFDAQFDVQGNNLACIAHPGYNLENIDNGVVSQVLVGNVVPDANNDYFFSGLSDSEGQNPTYQPIEVDGGICVLYPFIFAYGSNGYISNNNVSLDLADYATQNFYDWNGTFANQVNVASSKIVKGMPIRGGTNAPSGLFWATDSLIRVSFNPNATSVYWSYDIVSSQISIMSSNAVVEMDGTFFWMGVDRFYQYNGQVSVLANDKNVNYLFNNLNYEQRQKVWATKVPRYNEIWFFYPRGTSTECNDCIIYNVKDKLWYDSGQAVGSRRSCGYTTELFPTPIWASWEYEPLYDTAQYVIANPASLSAPTAFQFYLAGDQTTVLSPGSFLTLSTNPTAQTYQIVSSQNIYNTTIGTPGVTRVTVATSFGTTPAVGTTVFGITGGYGIWQHEFGVNRVSITEESAIYSSITTHDISWLTGNPSQDSPMGINRRMHLRRIEPNFLQSGTMSVTILGRKFAGGQNEENSGPFYFTQDTGKIDLRVEHRLIRLKFESNEVDGNYEMGRNLITAEFGDERP